jgi:hypothetical protein
MAPALGRTWPAMLLISVDFPAPLAPMIETTLLPGIATET